MTTIVKINIDKVTLNVLFKTISNINKEINETTFMQSPKRRRFQVKAQAQAVDIYMPNQFAYTIVLKYGSPWIKTGPDHELVNNKPVWECDPDQLRRATRENHVIIPVITILLRS